jgi:hypothetical protein
VACEGVPAHVWKLRLSGGPSEQLAAALTDSPGRRATATVADNDEADEP